MTRMHSQGQEAILQFLEEASHGETGFQEVDELECGEGDVATLRVSRSLSQRDRRNGPLSVRGKVRSWEVASEITI